MLTCYTNAGPLVLSVTFPHLEARHGAQTLMNLVTHPWDYDLHLGERHDLPAYICTALKFAEPHSWLAFDAESRLVAGAIGTYGTDGEVDPAVWVNETGQPAAGHPRMRRPSRGWSALYRAAQTNADGLVQDGTEWDHPSRYRSDDED